MFLPSEKMRIANRLCYRCRFPGLVRIGAMNRYYRACVVECGGKQSATPLSNDIRRTKSSMPIKPQQRSKAVSQPPHSKTLRRFGPLTFALFLAVTLHALPTPVNVLTNAEQIRELPPSQTANAIPVSLTGVMIDAADPSPLAIILADQTAGIYVRANRDTNMFTTCHRGDLLEIRGVTDPGQFAPIVIADSVKKAGTAKIPAAQPATFQQLITGALDGQWVEINGVIRQYFPPDPATGVQRIIVASDGGLVSVRFYPKPGQTVEADAEVRVRAVCLYQFNQRRQALTPVLQIPKGDTVLVTKPALAKPYDVPVRSASSLLMFSPHNLFGYAHRVHLRGIVTCCQPGAFVWIRDDSMGLCIQTAQEQPLFPGDEIDILGFPTPGSYPPMLGNSIFRKIGSTSPLPPLMLAKFDDAFSHEDDLVAVDGTLSQIQPTLNGLTLTLDKDGQSFKALLKTGFDGPAVAQWQTGSKVRLVGICSLSYDETRAVPGPWQPQSFQIVLRSPADLTVLAPPPWWTLKHFTMLLGIITGVLISLIGLIVAFSRARLREQKRHREMAEAQFAAVLSERNRMAREIHDTVAQGLAATSVQLRLAKKYLNGASETVTGHLDAAQQLVRDSLEESRNSIWNMRAHVLENEDLPGALRGILKHLADGTDMATRFDVIGRSRRLAPVIENNILRIGQEAISNATKHSGARHIDVVLEYEDQRFRLRVKDDGHGFDPENPPASDGGFGLIGMRERAVELRAQLNIRSAPDHGAEITLNAPLSKE
ncbi:MAG TPA: sensor histidine kinase [Verrucomicrobiae bacterium]|jgi:signal transduction histidine kinase|nr:sensor histidine kinase [Verrucomicrobiae bacterium]